MATTTKMADLARAQKYMAFYYNGRVTSHGCAMMLMQVASIATLNALAIGSSDGGDQTYKERKEGERERERTMGRKSPSISDTPMKNSLANWGLVKPIYRFDSFGQNNKKFLKLWKNQEKNVCVTKVASDRWWTFCVAL